MGRIELRAEIPAVSTEHRACDRREQGAVGLADQIRPQQECAARTMLPRAPRSVVENRRQLTVDLVEIARGILVEDDDIGAEPFEPPVLLCLQDLTDERQVAVAA